MSIHHAHHATITIGDHTPIRLPIGMTEPGPTDYYLGPEFPIGARVRIVHHTRPGTVVRNAYTSLVDGGRRQLVRWDIVPGTEPEENTTDWDPAVLVPLGQPLEEDPMFVRSGITFFVAPGIFCDGPFIGKVNRVPP